MLNFLNNNMKSRVKIIKEVPKNIIHKDWKLCFQWCQYIYENGSKLGFNTTAPQATIALGSGTPTGTQSGTPNPPSPGKVAWEYDWCPSSKYSIKSPYSMTPQYITIHNTANDASARNEVSYMNSNNN